MHSKANQKQNEKTTYRMGKIFSNVATDKRLISKIYKELIQLNIKKNFLNGQNIKIDNFPKKTYRWAKGT